MVMHISSDASAINCKSKASFSLENVLATRTLWQEFRRLWHIHELLWRIFIIRFRVAKRYMQLRWRKSIQRIMNQLKCAFSSVLILEAFHSFVEGGNICLHWNYIRQWVRASSSKKVYLKILCVVQKLPQVEIESIERYIAHERSIIRSSILFFFQESRCSADAFLVRSIFRKREGILKVNEPDPGTWYWDGSSLEGIRLPFYQEVVEERILSRDRVRVKSYRKKSAVHGGLHAYCEWTAMPKKTMKHQ